MVILREYQLQGINRAIKKFNCRVIIADEMGLGKTIQAIKIIEKTQKIPAVICCPASLKYNWVREFEKFAPQIPTFLCSGRKVNAPKKFHGAYIINYEILQYWADFFLEKKMEILIADESHFCKNIKAARTKAALKISRICNSVILLTGTPIENKPIELFYQVQMINRNLFPSWLKFAKHYNSCRKTIYGWQMGAAKNTQELHEILIKNCMIRRKKDDVLKELPAIIRQIIPVEISNREEYEEANNDIINWIKTNTVLDTIKAKKVIQMTRIDKLKYISAAGKLDSISDWVNNESENQKLVVFCYHKKILEEMSKRIKNCLTMASETSKEQRDDYVQRFQNDDKVRVMLTTMRVGGVGLTLTAAWTTVFIQLDWVPSIHSQCESRVHRIGQKSSVVNAIYFIARDTIEEKIMGLIDGKRNDISKVIDGEESEESEILTKIMESLYAEY